MAAVSLLGVCMVVEAGNRCQAAGMQVHRGRVQMWGFRLASSNCTATMV